MIPLFKVFMASEVNDRLAPILQSGYVGQGPQVDKFEEQLAEYLGTKYVLTVNSATSGLTLAFRLIKDYAESMPGKGLGTHIMSTPLTCTATNWAILAAGFDIQWVDINAKDCNLDPDDLEEYLSASIAGVSVVHWGGYSVDLDRIDFLKQRHEAKYHKQLMVVEDCAHAFGGGFDGKKFGNHGNIAVYSFQAIKHLTCGDGGLIVLPNKELYDKAKLLRWYGLDRESSADFRCSQNIKEWGYKFHMNDINATIGMCNLEYINYVSKKHKEYGEKLRSLISDVSGITTLENLSNRDNAYWVLTVLADDRDGLQRKLKEAGIMSSQVHARNDKHECVRKYQDHLEVMDYVADKILCLPCGWWLKDEDVDYIANVINSGW